ncbi:MAG: nucleoside kinase [Lachnospiraceae bacterium]|nr:nucleoside kinase [Lachnospiraceae bacterium]
MITLKINGKDCLYDEGLKYEVIAGQFQSEYKDRISLITMNGKIRELMKKADRDGTLDFITTTGEAGHRTYCRTAIMIMMKAVEDVQGKGASADVKVDFTNGPAFFCCFRGVEKMSQELTDKIKDRMQKIIEANIPITKKSYPLDEGIELFKKRGMNDKVKLFGFRRSSNVNVYCLGDYYDYYYGYMMPSTGYVDLFDLVPYENGVMLVLPWKHDHSKLPEFKPRRKLYETMTQSGAWNAMMGIDSVGDLNELICANRTEELIMVHETLQERRIGEIAREIKSRETVKAVLVAGPSSSGKTTFSKRLSVQLVTMGLKPHMISLDDYYLDHEFTPLDEEGNPDYETVDALDTKRFSEDMNSLLAGNETELPIFDFQTGKRHSDVKRMKLEDNDVLVIEGIHALGDKLIKEIPREKTFRIFISALTSLNIDEHNRIPTTDTRLIRRLIRDYRTRASSAQRTIGMWDSVRRGEEKYIFPFQEEADVFFNSSLVYELAVLKPYAEPLLYSVPKGTPEYYEAKRLLKFFDYFLTIPETAIPGDSLAREFIGRGIFGMG